MRTIGEQILSGNFVDTAKSMIDSLAKPPGSLGRLEELASRLASIQHSLRPVATPRRLVLFAADHGVVESGVSAWPAVVTQAMVQTIRRGRAASNVLAQSTNTDIQLVDVGVAGPNWEDDQQPHGIYRRRRVRPGTRNLAIEPAMTVAEFRDAFQVGIDLAEEAKRDGIAIVAAGEMGIGNTTAALPHCSQACRQMNP
jgi:nicotinate-nucleotide--dimethylbenzimidazole phosphoribosyltransferase